MNHKYILALLLVAIPLVCFSQIEVNDTISFGQNGPEDISIEAVAKPDCLSGTKSGRSYHSVYTPSLNDPLSPYRLTQPLDFHIHDLSFTPGRASLLHWNSGAIIASGGTRAFPGLMQIDNGALGIYQSAGNFTFHVGGIANKYGYFNGLQTQYGLHGSITYQFSPRVSATIFGDYYFGRPSQMSNGMPMPPSIIGYYGRTNYGGYVDFQLNEHWGVQTGVQSVQQIGTNRYKAEPVVTPYYKINKKVAIGLPVGQILYHILRK